MIRKDDKYSSIKLNKTKQRELIHIIKKYNLIRTGKSSYHLKPNLFSRPKKLACQHNGFSHEIYEILWTRFLYIFLYTFSILKDQGMKLNELNAWQSRKESHSSQIHLKPLLQASSIAKMTLITSAYKDFCTPRKEEKLPIYSPLLPRKKPTHVEKPGHPLIASSVLTFLQLIWGNSQII